MDQNYSVGISEVEAPETDRPQEEAIKSAQEVPKEEVRTSRRKKKRKRRRKSKNYLARILIALIVIATVICVLHIDYFKVAKIEVTGNSYLSEESVLKGSKIKTGRNIFDTIGFLEKGRIEKNPYVVKARIHKHYPDKITVEVTEPMGMGQLVMGEQFVVVDNDGIVLEVAKKQHKISLIRGIEAKKAQVGSPVVLVNETNFEKAMELLLNAEKGDMFFKEISIEKNRVTAKVYGELKVEGTLANVTDALASGTLKTVVYDLYQKGIKKGTIYVSGDNYCSFTKK